MIDLWKLSNGTSGSDGFNPIPIQQVVRQYLRQQGADMATVFLQASLADTNHNGIFDTAEEYKKFCTNMEKNMDTSYQEIDYSYKKPDISYDF
jgi:hypothetical protein